MKTEKKYERPKVYLAGSITNDENYKEKFNKAEQYLIDLGYIVFNPALSPDGLTYREYINLGLNMLVQCDCICILPNSETSKGTQFEKHYAELVGMPIINVFGNKE